MNADTRKPQAKAVQISSLKEHPRQAEFFSHTSQAELNELAQSLDTYGLQERIHCCADGTLLRGHRRVAAAKRLGWTSIKALVRHDLDGPDDPRATEDLINDNLHRRQLDELALARCYRELKSSAAALPSAEGGDMRDLLAERMNCGKSGRTLDRLLNLLDLPRDIQDMISNKSLTKANAGVLLKLPQKIRTKVYGELRKGNDFQSAIRRYGRVSSAQEKSPAAQVEKPLTQLHQCAVMLGEDVTRLDSVRVKGVDLVEVLTDVADFLSGWRDRILVTQGKRKAG